MIRALLPCLACIWLLAPSAAESSPRAALTNLTDEDYAVRFGAIMQLVFID